VRGLGPFRHRDLPCRRAACLTGRRQADNAKCLTANDYRGHAALLGAPVLRGGWACGQERPSLCRNRRGPATDAVRTLASDVRGPCAGTEGEDTTVAYRVGPFRKTRFKARQRRQLPASRAGLVSLTGSDAALSSLGRGAAHIRWNCQDMDLDAARSAGVCLQRSVLIRGL